MFVRGIGRILGRGLCAGVLTVSLTPVVVDAAVSCPDFMAKRVESFRKIATAGAARCLKRSVRTGVACPDPKLSDQLTKKRARLALTVGKRCPGSPIDQALSDTQAAVLCQVLAVCEALPLGEVTQRLFARTTLEEPPAPRDLTVDIGWQGLTHGLRLLEGAQFTANLSGCDGETDTLCDIDGATTGLSFGPPSPVVSAGLGFCLVLDFAADVTGTIDVATGEVSEQTSLHGAFYNGAHAEEVVVNPCPLCVPTDEDPEIGESGLCSAGPRAGLACTVQGLTRPANGGVSHDCLPDPLSFMGEFTVPVTATTGSFALATTSESPKCTGVGFSGQKCPCDTCNNAAATMCASNADCPESGGAPGICGGRRCMGGTDPGRPCSSTSECPGSQTICARAGYPTVLNPCYDGVCTPDGDGNGYCAEGPSDSVCELEPARFCAIDEDCPLAGDHCGERLRTCFTDPITATGTPDVPANASAQPVLVGGFCMGPTHGAALNYVTGLPGPVRFVWPAQLTFGD